MCLLVVACGMSARHPLVLAANRDERHQRPALAVHWWHDRPDVFGGRDLVANGSWLAVDRRGRFAAVTNFREPPAARPPQRSRGQLVADFLAGDESADAFAADLTSRGSEYAAFNLLLFDGETLLCASNRAPTARLGRGIHALGNGPLGAPWPKLAAARRGMEAALPLAEPTSTLLELLADRGPAAERTPYEAALFIPGIEYGTRSSAVILADADGHLAFTERRFGPGGAPAGESRHEFELDR